MSYTPPLDAEVTAFVTTALLASGATFNSGVLDADGKTQVQTEINASHDGTIDISFCADSACSEVVRSLSIPYTAADGYQFFAAPAFVNYIKYEFTNTTAATQTDFYYTTKFLTTGLSPQLLTTDAFIAPAMVTELGRNIQVGTNPSGTFTNAKVDGVGFQTTDDLATGATFSSDVIDAQGYTQVQTHIVSDQDGTLGFKFCSTSDCSGTTVGADGVERYLSVPYVADNGFQLFAAPAFTPYVQYTFENTGDAATTQLFYETKLLTKALSGQLLGIEAFIAPAMVANLGRNVIVGKNEAGDYNNVAIDTENNLNVNVSNPKTAYDELPIAEMTAIAQLTYPYNINTDMNLITLSGSGVVVQEDNMAVLSSSTTTQSQAILASINTIPYRAGQGVISRFDAVFTSGHTCTDCRQWIGVGDANDGFLLGYDGTDFSVTYRTNGTATIIDQPDWNTDVMDGTGSGSNPSGMLLDPTKGNVYQISYGSGFGAVNYSIESDLTGNMVLVHVLDYNNKNIIPSSFNPTFPMCAEVYNGTSNDDIILKTAMMASFIEGRNEITGPLNAHKSLVLGIDDGSNAEYITLSGASTFAGKTNKVECLIESVSVSQDSKVGGNIFITEDASVTTPNAFTNVGLNTSVVLVSDGEEGTGGGAGTSLNIVSGGKLLWASGVGKEAGTSYNISNLNLRLRPGHTLTFSMEKFPAAGSEDASMSVVWKEDF
jgi:hypothetical protein